MRISHILKTAAMSIFLASILQGCFFSNLLNIGEEKSYCEEHGRDMTDAGVCKNSYELMQDEMRGR